MDKNTATVIVYLGFVLMCTVLGGCYIVNVTPLQQQRCWLWRAQENGGGWSIIDCPNSGAK